MTAAVHAQTTADAPDREVQLLTGTELTVSVDYATQIQPLLKKHCYDCHDAENAESGLRLDVRRPALQGGDSGAAIVPGKSTESRLIAVVTGADQDFGRMPPEDEGRCCFCC